MNENLGRLGGLERLMEILKNLTIGIGVVVATIPAGIGIGMGTSVYDIVIKKRFEHWLKKINKVHAKVKKRLK